MAGSLARLQRVARVGANPVPRNQLVVGVKRRSMAFGAALLFEDPAATCSCATGWIRVGRWLERVEVFRERVQLCVAIARAAGFGRRVVGTVTGIGSDVLGDRRITHQITNVAVADQTGVVEEATLL